MVEKRSRRVSRPVPRLRILLEVELEGPMAVAFQWRDAPTLSVRRRAWDWMLSRPGFAEGFEALLGAVDRMAP